MNALKSTRTKIIQSGLGSSSHTSSPQTSSSRLPTQTYATTKLTIMQSKAFLEAVKSSPSHSECLEVLGTSDYTSSDLETLITLGSRSRDRLASHNLRLVEFYVTQTLSKRRNNLLSLTRSDLIQEGCLGLLRAIDKYDPTDSRGASFATYAGYWVRASVLRALAEKEDLVRVPYHVSGAVRKILKVKGGGWDDYEDAKKLAMETGMGEGKVRDVLGVIRRKGGYVEFDAGYHGGGEWTEGGEGGRGEGGVQEGMEVLLSEDERTAVELRFGLGGRVVVDREVEEGRGGEERTYMEVGKVMELSGEYARRLVKRGLEKLRRGGDEWNGVVGEGN
ncbi:hypothetical protein TrCOL_g8831 [Triparma columacea]|uniref:RNA polymerase sigma-70 domain-containing protein n=1 Tax=Triparma columacea TaxID=722753 RepID=A0A9W7GMC3_9STRA|nr:hypothetical protein TrCOL_g8831 [Triparma columacea]